MKTGQRLAIGGVLILALVAGLASCANTRNRDPETFGIYVSNLAGDEPRLLLSSSWQQMTHPRVSPDGKWLTLTRYNKRNLQGLALEKNGYQNTEIMIMRMDGTELETVVKPRLGRINANSHFADGGRSLIWFSTDNPKKAPQIMKVDLRSREVTRVPTPPDLKTTDPHHVGNTLVFPTVGPNVESLWIMKLDGSAARQLTHPKFPAGMAKGKWPHGDYDPKLSPDGRKVAFMRLFGKEGWRTFVIDVASGKEKDLSGPGSIDALPDWSSDGRLLLFWHIDKKNLAKMGIYTMRPDGSNRKMVDLPRGYLHGHPQFLPGGGSSKRAGIIYAARKAPHLP